jgi:hypothetical protein
MKPLLSILQIFIGVRINVNQLVCFNIPTRISSTVDSISPVATGP